MYFKQLIAFVLLVTLSLGIVTNLSDQFSGKSAVELNEQGEASDEKSKEKEDKGKEDHFKHLPTSHNEFHTGHIRPSTVLHISFLISEWHRTLLEVPPEA